MNCANNTALSPSSAMSAQATVTATFCNSSLMITAAANIAINSQNPTACPRDDESGPDFSHYEVKFILYIIIKDHPVRWSLFKEAPRTGFEPVTYRLTAGRSTVELSRNTCSA